MSHPDPALFYRHIVVKRKSMVNMTASSADLRALREARSQGGSLPENLKHLAHLIYQAPFDGEAEVAPSREELLQMGVAQLRALARNMKVERVRSRNKEEIIDLILEQDPLHNQDTSTFHQEGIIVASLQKQHIPGGSEPLPLTPTVLTHPGFHEAEDAMGDFKKAAEELQARFKKYSDNKFQLLSPEFQKGCTLVTVVYTPITASPKLTKGLDLFCEFHQVTRFGSVDTSDFEVYSDNGEFPVTPPGSLEMAMLMKSADEILPTPAVE